MNRGPTTLQIWRGPNVSLPPTLIPTLPERPRFRRLLKVSVHRPSAPVLPACGLLLESAQEVFASLRSSLVAIHTMGRQFPKTSSGHQIHPLWKSPFVSSNPTSSEQQLPQYHDSPVESHALSSLEDTASP